MGKTIEIPSGDDILRMFKKNIEKEQLKRNMTKVRVSVHGILVDGVIPVVKAKTYIQKLWHEAEAKIKKESK